MKRLLGCFLAALLTDGLVCAQTWPDYHLTNGTHYTSYGVETYNALEPVKNLWIDPVAVLQAGATQLDDIYDGNQVYLNGGTIYASAIDENDFTWNSGSLHLNGGVHVTTYGLDSGSGKTLNIDSGALVQLPSINTIPGGNQLNLNSWGKITTGNFDASKGFNFEAGTLEVQGALSGFTFPTTQYLESSQFPVSPGEYDSTLLLNGSGAEWDLGGEQLYLVGWDVYRHRALIVSNGASLVSSVSSLGESSSVDVAGNGSLWSAGSIELSSGQAPRPSLTISDGGVVNCESMRIGSTLGFELEDGEIQVLGAGSQLSIERSLELYGSNNKVRIVDGGVVVVSNYVSCPDSVGNAGKIIEVVGDGSRLETGGIGLGSAGTLLIKDGGYVETTLFSGAGGSWGGSAIIITGAGSKWNNFGSLQLANGEFGNSMTVTNGGEAFIGGSITVGPGDPYQGRPAGITLENGGRLTLGSNFDASMYGFYFNEGGTLAVQGELTGLSTLEADRRLEAATVLGDLTAHGTYAPGNSPADSILDGILTIASDGTLEMELAGMLLGDEYDRLTVTDAAYLDGTLDIVLLDGFSLSYGDSFDLFNWDGGVIGEFDTITTSALTGSLEWDTSELYTNGTLTVIPEPASFSLIGLVAGGIYFVRRVFPAI